MSKLDELIQEFCPDGVEYKALGDLGAFYGGLGGKSKNDFKDGNAKFITYKNVYSNLALRLVVDDRVKIAEGEKQHTLQYGDVVFTGSSETPDECGFSSVVTIEPDEKFYLNSFCFFFRFSDLSIMLPDFAKHLFRSSELRSQIGKTASGVTRYNVSKKLMARIKIPLPPLEVQREIVRILDNFTALTTELAAELEARKKQYEFYRDKLLTFDTSGLMLELKSEEVAYMQLKEVARYAKRRITVSEVNNRNYVGVENLLQNKQGKTDASTVPSTGSVIAFDKGDVLIGNIRPYLKKIWLADCSGGTNGDVLAIQIVDREQIMPQFLYYVLSSDRFFVYVTQNSKGAKMPRGDKDAVMKYEIPVPSLEVQRKIVSVLNNFYVLCNDLTSGLPAEIEARRKQYEYYRDKLLTFKEAKV